MLKLVILQDLSRGTCDRFILETELSPLELKKKIEDIVKQFESEHRIWYYHTIMDKLEKLNLVKQVSYETYNIDVCSVPL